mmetsp:Transcript_21889/g.51873  ORF Transcript_21889/g.51873 Transcript_21889/m.51873 type:complete len:261 (+) Transcript_21889:448-1230(+)
MAQRREGVHRAALCGDEAVQRRHHRGDRGPSCGRHRRRGVTSESSRRRRVAAVHRNGGGPDRCRAPAHAPRGTCRHPLLWPARKGGGCGEGPPRDLASARPSAQTLPECERRPPVRPQRAAPAPRPRPRGSGRRDEGPGGKAHAAADGRDHDDGVDVRRAQRCAHARSAAQEEARHLVPAGRPPQRRLRRRLHHTARRCRLVHRQRGRRAAAARARRVSERVQQAWPHAARRGGGQVPRPDRPVQPVQRARIAAAHCGGW